MNVNIKLLNQKNKGSALLSALFVMTLIAIIASSLSLQLHLNIHRAKLIFSYDKLNLSTDAVKFWAIDYLNAKKAKLIDNELGYIATYPNNLTNIYPNITLSGEIYDLQKNFNINNLLDKKYHLTFLNLLEKILPKKNPESLKNILANIQKWESAYQPQKGQNEYIKVYQKMKDPYNPAYQPLKSITELRLINGIDEKLYQTILPFVSALPEVTPINLNNASKIVLSSLGNGLSETQVNYILEERGLHGFKPGKDISKLLQKLQIPAIYTTIESQYFLCKISASYNEFDIVKYVILKRIKNKKKSIKTLIISEHVNTL